MQSVLLFLYGSEMDCVRVYITLCTRSAYWPEGAKLNPLTNQDEHSNSYSNNSSSSHQS